MNTYVKGTILNNLVISYLSLRCYIGWVGIVLPFMLLLHAIHADIVFPASISGYYHTEARDFFVGVLFVLGAFLMAYEGYDIHDTFVSTVVSVCSFGVAMYPTPSVVHFISALFFFIGLIYFCLVLFRKGSSTPTNEKLIRNKLYLVCGIIMIVCIGIIAIYKLSGIDLERYKIVFIFESIALWAFGVSWLVKGEYILKDKIKWESGVYVANIKEDDDNTKQE